jgi:hypothetical protein
MKSLSFVGCLMVALMVLLFAVGLVTSALPARAQSGPQCAPWPDVAAGLVARYGESVLFVGTPAPGGQSIVIMAKSDGTTWTALTIDASGLACLRGSGGGWSAGGSPAAPGQEG